MPTIPGGGDRLDYGLKGQQTPIRLPLTSGELTLGDGCDLTQMYAIMSYRGHWSVFEVGLPGNISSGTGESVCSSSSHL